MKALAVLSAGMLCAAAFGQGAILHDTATVEIVDMPTAMAMRAQNLRSRFVLNFDFDFETGRTTFRSASSGPFAMRSEFDESKLSADLDGMPEPRLAMPEIALVLH
ncbi:MAG TPA: hypothetical protein VMI31_06180 [Fimbriimonadaceae bacterium]|nr:hypothetical protein [Fimbriimonadaceae bacterium]